MIVSDKLARVCRLAIAALVGAVYAFGFFVTVEGFVGAAEKADDWAVAVPILVCGFLEGLLIFLVRGLARKRLLIVRDVWLLVLSAVVLVASFYAYGFTRYGGNIDEYVGVVVGSALFSLPAYFGFRGTAVDKPRDWLT